MSVSHHYLKTLPEYYVAVCEGKKTFEVRFNDRDYKVGDLLHLQEFYDGEYTGRELIKEISYILDSSLYCIPGYVIIAIRDV